MEEEKKLEEQPGRVGEEIDPGLEMADRVAEGTSEPEPQAESLTPEQVAALKAELELYRAKADENLDGWQRALADFANYKKRVERERSTVYQTALGQVLLRYLEILDDLNLALKERPQDGDGATWAEGIELISRKLVSFLESQNVEPIKAEGKDFDPTMHEALSMEPSETYASGQIIEVVQTGYRIGERVLRPARVRVAQ